MPLFAGESQTVPYHRMGPAFIDFYLIHHVIKGKGYFQQMGREYHLQAGDSFVIFPKEMYLYEADADEPWHYMWVGFQGRDADQILSNLNISAYQPIIHCPKYRKINVLYRQFYRTLKRSDELCNMEMTGYLRLLFAEYGKNQMLTEPSHKQVPMTDIERQVDQAVRWLQFKYAEQISIAQMAHSLGYHRIYLSKMFKEHTGMSPMQYVTKIRMERAKNLMTSKLSMQQIAASVGFKDPLYFSKQYKKWHGVTPTDHRTALSSKSGYDCSM
ncbi:AraC family transcriptional regulator [Paenibacillus sp. N1-5-1-14]|uniref:AraC family transcriptional regulator n=1 Tax=Paenibacillus radicibacter TaxID=2972488 RepID=UPI0021599609|nr:AraC family transcriptional regulator [Paenibacillus radicibacter]MCR8642752.1 AraC family transcriptional regulator [Paenibacillus radicibacter]